MVLSYSNKSLLNTILLQLYGSEFTIESHNVELEGATLWTISFKSVLLDPNAICWTEQSTDWLNSLASPIELQLFT